MHVNNLNPITKVKVVDTPYSNNLTTREGEQLLQIKEGSGYYYAAQIINTEKDKTYTVSAWVFQQELETDSSQNIIFTARTDVGETDQVTGDFLEGCEDGGSDCHTTSTHENKGSWEKL